jgi:hypothetical protein
MSEERLLTRRRFMALALAFSAPLVPGVVPGLSLGDPRISASARLTALIRHRDSAARIGRAYLRTAPADRDAERLLDAIVATVATGTDGDDPLAADDVMLADMLARQIASDFASRDVALVEGWVLSRTEARLCALVALA